jgi:hypothetical protein
MERRLSILAVAAMILGAAGCGDDPVSPEPLPWVRPPATPEAVLHGIEDIYNDKQHPTSEKLAAFESWGLESSPRASTCVSC